MIPASDCKLFCLLAMYRLCQVAPLQSSLRMTQQQLQQQPSQIHLSRCKPLSQSCSNKFKPWPRPKKPWQSTCSANSQAQINILQQCRPRVRVKPHHRQSRRANLLRGQAEAGCHPYRLSWVVRRFDYQWPGSIAQMHERYATSRCVLICIAKKASQSGVMLRRSTCVE